MLLIKRSCWFWYCWFLKRYYILIKNLININKKVTPTEAKNIEAEKELKQQITSYTKLINNLKKEVKLYYTILYYTILCYTILYYTIPYYTILYYTILYYIILYYTILHYTILYYTILHYTHGLLKVRSYIFTFSQKKYKRPVFQMRSKRWY